MKPKALLGILAVTLVAVGAAGAASAAKDPLALVLQRADFPRATTWTSGRLPAGFGRPAGVQGEAAFYSAELVVSAAKSEMIGGLVAVFGSQADARKFYRIARETERRERGGRPVRLPSYGDEHGALLNPDPIGASIIVRKGPIVWQLSVGAAGVLVMTRAQVLAELKRYALKQKRRVGAG